MQENSQINRRRPMQKDISTTGRARPGTVYQTSRTPPCRMTPGNGQYSSSTQIPHQDSTSPPLFQGQPSSKSPWNRNWQATTASSSPSPLDCSKMDVSPPMTLPSSSYRVWAHIFANRLYSGFQSPCPISTSTTYPRQLIFTTQPCGCCVPHSTRRRLRRQS